MHAVTAVVLLGMAAVAAYPRNVTKVLTVSNGLPWGDWGPVEFCPPKTYARHVELKVERPCDCDDTGLNAIKLNCVGLNWNGGNKTASSSVTSSQGEWGSWEADPWDDNSCYYYGSHMVGFGLYVEPNQGSRDDTAANTIGIKCRQLEHGGKEWSAAISSETWMWATDDEWSEECPWGSAICGLQT